MCFLGPLDEAIKFYEGATERTRDELPQPRKDKPVEAIAIPIDRNLTEGGVPKIKSKAG
jgi:hypothetical protein